MPDPASDTSRFAEGMVVATGGAIALCAVLLPLAAPVILAIGVAQLIYVVPVALVYRNRGHMRALKGLMAGAAVIFLLNATCWGVGLAVT